MDVVFLCDAANNKAQTLKYVKKTEVNKKNTITTIDQNMRQYHAYIAIFELVRPFNRGIMP